MTKAQPPPRPIPEPVRRIAQLVEIQTVRLAKAGVETLQAGPNDQISELNLKLRVGSQRGPHPRALYALVGVDVQPSSKGEPKRVLAKLSCDFAVHYILPDDQLLSTISDEDAQLFAGYNAVYNVWPYARELLQSLSARMMLPAVLLPLFRPGMFAPPEDWTSAGQADVATEHPS